MASIHRDPKGRSPYWYAAFTGSDGKRQFTSTKTTNKKQALKICASYAKAGELGRAGKLTPERAREVIADTVSDLFLTANREDLPRATVRSWCTAWLASKKIEAEPTTFFRYKGIIERFLTHLGPKPARKCPRSPRRTLMPGAIC